MPLYPLPLIVFIAGIVAMVAASIADNPRALLVALFVPVTGTVVYAVARRRGLFHTPTNKPPNTPV